jgi:hypothetical protein
VIVVIERGLFHIWKTKPPEQQPERLQGQGEMKRSHIICHGSSALASATVVPPEVRADLAASLAVALIEHSREQQLEINWLREQLQFACAMLRPAVEQFRPPGTVLQ